MGLDRRADFEQQRFDALSGRFDEERPVVLTDILTQEVKPFLNIRYLRFLGR